MKSTRINIDYKCDINDEEISTEGGLPEGWAEKSLSVSNNSLAPRKRRVHICSDCRNSENPIIIKKIKDLLLS